MRIVVIYISDISPAALPPSPAAAAAGGGYFFFAGGRALCMASDMPMSTPLTIAV